MLCWFCAEPARATCRFCGRGVCAEHARFGPYILQVSRSENRRRVEALVVDDAVQCGSCRPRPHAVAMPELD
ncbi:hypothetical protein AB0J83_24595 [Actinoplanes sp. NPDC049596]|uniref:hypothetical protein n=1 Tax=unclassified Actinoplanes TaxID=2626549 RepID=UPI00341C8CDA